MTYWNDVEEANKKIQELEAEVSQLKGAMFYLETNKIPWLEFELEMERRRQRGSSGLRGEP